MSIWKPGTPTYFGFGYVIASTMWISKDYPYAHVVESALKKAGTPDEPRTAIEIEAYTGLSGRPVACGTLEEAFDYIEAHAKRIDPANKL